MKAFAVWIMQGRWQAVFAASVLAILALLVTPLALGSAAVVMLTVLRQGWREGALVIGTALAVLIGFGFLLFQMPVAMLLMGVLLWLPAAVLGGVLGRSGELRVAIEGAALMAGVIVLLQYLLLGDPATFWADALNQFLRQSLDPETLAAVDLDRLVSVMAGWMAGGAAASWLLGMVLALVLARHWSALIDRPGAFGEEFRRLRFGRSWLIVVPLLLIGAVVLGGGRPNLVGQLFLVGMMVYLIQGISLAHALVAIFGAPPALLVGLYLLLVLVAPQGATLVAIAGYADGWLDIRARARDYRERRGGN